MLKNKAPPSTGAGGNEMRRFVLVMTVLFLILGYGRFKGGAQGAEAVNPGQKTVSEGEKKESPLDKSSLSEHSLQIGEHVIRYSARAGFTRVRIESGGPEADLFYVAYTQNPEETKRPVTFAFNGGPGASSVWLHLGAIGPKRVLVREKKVLAPPYELVDNLYSWLQFTDLVFIDPVGTGYSRAVSEADTAKFFGVEPDIRSVGDFIRDYVTRNGRWLSPKFLVGESYGTTRAAGLAEYLQVALGMNLNGIVLISPALEFQAITFSPGNDLPYALYLPSYTVAAWYHKKLSPERQADFEKTRTEVEAFALREYLPALAKGNALSHQDREGIIEKLAACTSLSSTYIRNHNLRIKRSDFMRELLRQENLEIGALDSRVTADYTPDRFIEDPSVFITVGPLTAAWNYYVTKDLKFETEIPYIVLSGKASQSWNWGSAAQGFLNVADNLQKSMRMNPLMKVLVLSGYYDLDTAYFSAEYTANHIHLPPDLQKNLSLAFLDAGHQMYVHVPSLEKMTRLAEDLFTRSMEERMKAGAE
jgi:carboxypeptidase C (cathepsin A)